MLWVPQKGKLRVAHNTGNVGSANVGTACTTGAASGTKGTPAELFASTAFDAYWMIIMASNYGTSTTASDGAMDILTGAATESVLIPNLLMGGCGSFAAAAAKSGKLWEFPLYVPAGSRLAVQAAGLRLSTAFRVAMWLFGGEGVPPFRVGTQVTTYGMGTVPDGTAITPGASGAEGSWTQIVASTTADHFAFIPSFQVTSDTTQNNLGYQVDVGLGSATEQQIGQWWFATDNGEAMTGPIPGWPVFQDIPSGTRLVMRASCSGALDAGYNGVIHAIS